MVQENIKPSFSLYTCLVKEGGNGAKFNIVHTDNGILTFNTEEEANLFKNDAERRLTGVGCRVVSIDSLVGCKKVAYTFINGPHDAGGNQPVLFYPTKYLENGQYDYSIPPADLSKLQ